MVCVRLACRRPGGKRLDWAADLDLVPLAEQPEQEILFWVGCSGSFDNRSIKISRALVKIMRAAGVKFGVLGIEERCCGETARRLGNEYLAQMLIQANIETLNKYQVKRIVTICPHGTNRAASAAGNTSHIPWDEAMPAP